MLILVAFCGQGAPKGEPNRIPMEQIGYQKASKRRQMTTRGGPRSPKRRVQGGVREKVGKKNAPGRESVKQMGPKLHNFWSHVAHFRVICSMFFQGRFLIDLFMVFGLIFEGFLDVCSMSVGPFSRTPEPLFFDNSTVR